jgi:hypothetical protein
MYLKPFITLFYKLPTILENIVPIPTWRELYFRVQRLDAKLFGYFHELILFINKLK